MTFTLDTLKSKINELKKNSNKTQVVLGEWPNCVFLPEGTHKGRFIIDPNGDIYDKYATYGYFAKGVRAPEYLDKSELPEGFDSENHILKQMSEVLSKDYLKFKYGVKWNFITYFYLMETDNKSDSWQPGNLYCIIGNNKFGTAFTSFMSSMSDSLDSIFEIMDPSKPCVGWISMTVSRGAQGSVAITYIPHKCDAICPRSSVQTDIEWLEEISKLGYKPLSMSYIKPGFNQEKYDLLCNEYSVAYEEIKKDKEAGAEENEEFKLDSSSEMPSLDEEQKEEEIELKETQKQPKQKKKETITSIPPVSQDVDVFAKFRVKK